MGIETVDPQDKKSKAVAEKISLRWYSKETSKSAASSLFAAATAVELWSYNRYQLSIVCTRYMTDRAIPSIYGYAMSQRVSSLAATLNNAVYSPPVFNVIATAADVLSTRIWKNRPFITVTPNDGDYKARTAAKSLGIYVDGLFDQLDYWNLVETIGIDCMTTGTGIIKISEGLDGNIKLTRVLESEILISDEEAAFSNPKSMIQRVFVNKEDLAAKYKDDPDALAAIKSAASVFAGYSYNSEPNYSDIIPLVEGWRLPLPDGSPGRHMLCVGNYPLLDESYTDEDFPFVVIRYKQLSLSWFGQGLAEQLLPLQREICRVTDAISENTKRNAWPRVLVHTGAQMNPNSLKGPGIVYWNGTQKPDFVTPTANNQEIYQYLETLIVRAFKRAGISEQAAGGVKPPGLNSGRALETWNQIDDARHIDLGQRLEDFVTRTAEKVIKLASKLKPTVTTAGRTRQVIDWDEAKFITNKFAIKAFPISRLSQTESARQQQIDDWYANGVINKLQQLKLQQVPDTQGFIDLATASSNDIQDTLDTIVETQAYIPPDPAQDLKEALEAVQSRYLLEKTYKTPRKVLNLLLQWKQAVADLLQLNTVTPAAPQAVSPGAIGIQPPTVTPQADPSVVAPPPVQVLPQQGQP